MTTHHSSRPSMARLGHPGWLLASALTFLLGLAHPVAAQTEQAHFTPVGSLVTGNYANDLQFSGNFAYVADGLEGLKVMDVTDPAKPVRISAFATGGDARDLKVVGTLAYVAAGEAGLVVVDISNPAAPLRVGAFDTTGVANAVEVMGTVAYVADGLSGLQILDVTNAAEPVRLSVFNTPGDAAGVQVVDNLAYVADGESGLQIIDVGNPATPVRRGGFNTTGFAKAVQIVGQLAYVADGTAGLVILNVSNPVIPSRLSTSPQPGGRAYGVSVVGDYAYVADLWRGVAVYNVRVPASPVLLGNVSFNDEGYTVHPVGNLVYVAGGLSGLRVFSVRIGLTQELTLTGLPGEALALNTPYPVTAVASSGLPVTASVMGPATFSGGLLTVTQLGTVHFIAEQAGNEVHLPVRQVRSFNVPVASVTRRGGFDTGGDAHGVKVVGNLAYVADGTAGVQILDVGNAVTPVRRGGFNTAGFARAVEVVGALAYVADGEAGLQILDVSNPASPVRRGGFNTGGLAVDVQVVANLAYVADESGGLEIVDVTDPASPVRVGGFDTSGFALGVQVVGNRAYVADREPGLLILDVSDPAAPVQLGRFDTADWAVAVHVVGTTAYVIDDTFGLVVLDVTDPASPTRLGGIDTPGLAVGIQVVDTVAYIANGMGGIEVMDVSNPANPIRRGGFDTAGSSRAVQVVGDLAYVADQETGLQILDIHVGTPQVITANFPSTLTFAGQPLILDATTTAGLPLNYAVVSGPGTLQGNQLTFTGLGRVTIRVQQGGNTNYIPATREQSISVGPPILGARLAGTSPEVYWPAGLAGLTLEGRESLATNAPWKPVSLPGTEANGQVRVNVESSPMSFFRLKGYSGLVEPLVLGGWNRDVVLENASGYRAAPFDSFGAVWFESGVGGYGDGFPASRQIVSQLNADVIFELQPYASPNVLWLNSAIRTRSLTLATPAAYSRLYVLAHSAGGGGNGSLKIHYADGSVSGAIPFFAPDWWDGSPASPTRRPAISGLARSQTAGAMTYDLGSPASGFSLHQTDINLSTGANAGKVISRLEFTMSTLPEVTGIFAVSGVEVPPAP